MTVCLLIHQRLLLCARGGEGGHSQATVQMINGRKERRWILLLMDYTVDSLASTRATQQEYC